MTPEQFEVYKLIKKGRLTRPGTEGNYATEEQIQKANYHFEYNQDTKSIITVYDNLDDVSNAIIETNRIKMLAYSDGYRGVVEEFGKKRSKRFILI